MKKVIVIIPNYDKVDLLSRCIYYLKEQTYIDFDILVVDNGSKDGSVEYINENSDSVKSILLKKNTGFAYASNIGLKYSINSGYEYSILLNNDAYVHTDFVKELVNSIEDDKNAFARSSLMLSFSDKNIIDSFGDNYCILGWGFQNKIGENIDSIQDDEYCFSACGGASIYRNSALMKTGLLDESFFAYLEDIDLSYRAKLLGYNIKTCKNAMCYHLGSATSGSKYNNFKVNISARNNVSLLIKNMPIIQFIINIPFLFIGYIIKQVFFIFKGFGKDYLTGTISGFANLPNCFLHKSKASNIINYFKIELELFINLYKYTLNFVMRHIR